MKAARRKLDERQGEFSRIARDLDAIRQDTTPGSRADRINALYDEAGRIVDEYQSIQRSLIKQRAGVPDIEQ
ncbi:hypothetical protein [Chlorobium phaeovibrioides]|uniref:Uncharacterized protein n=1 Tax=Chlorobium phaeovibrioides TaxID=1094 RepID=A0A5M8I875_CHLPH|nr:hypothetical protein [Chlorobium phaeovibrioides]KAA6230394.1 hypothetical protein FP507_10900 [Chlorobium phaeovibrioides]MWV54981.1 hypothetical protein [Chlorobium phaeovibrioides]